MTDGGNLFIVTSAIHAHRSIFTPEQRINQTFQTIKSIHEKVPVHQIVLVDSTLDERMDDDVALVKSFRDHGVSVMIMRSQQLDELNLAKQNSAAEAMVMINVLDTLNKHPEMQRLLLQTKRIFKISGRYRLSPGFDIKDYDRPEYEGKYVFKKRLPSWMDESRKWQTGTDHLLITRLWSLDPSLVKEAFDSYHLIYDACVQFGIDLEHSTYKHINKANLVEVDKLNVEGELSAAGETVHD